MDIFEDHSPYSNCGAGQLRSPFGREVVPRAPLDKSVVLQAHVHLRAHSPAQRKHWHRQIEAVLHWYARRHRQRRKPVRVAPGFVQTWWLPPTAPGLPLTDVQVLLDPALKNFPKFKSLLSEISEIPELAELVAISLIVRRDYRFRDFNSISLARKKFDSLAPKFTRLAYEKLNQNKKLKENSEVGNQKRKKRSDARHEKIVGVIRTLQAKETPQRHWTKLILRALDSDAEFSEKSESARTRYIQRATKEFLSTPDGGSLRADETTIP